MRWRSPPLAGAHAEGQQGGVEVRKGGGGKPPFTCVRAEERGAGGPGTRSGAPSPSSPQRSFQSAPPVLAPVCASSATFGVKCRRVQLLRNASLPAQAEGHTCVCTTAGDCMEEPLPKAAPAV